MKITSSLLLTLLLLTNFSFSQNKIESAIASFVGKPGMEHASISIEVTDLSDNSTIASHNPLLTLPTASTAKLFSTATALDIMGPDYRAETRIYIEGTITPEGTLEGNVWIRGGGDPSIGSKYFYESGKQLSFMEPWIDSLKNHGIKKISGSVIADASEFGYEGAPDGWNWVDMGNYYGAGPSGLTIYDNLLRYTFSTSSKSGVTSTIKSIEPHVPDLIYHNYVKSSYKKGDNAYLYGAPYSLDRFGSGTLPVNSASFVVKGSLPDPEQQFAYELTEALKASEIMVSGDPKAARSLEVWSTEEDYAKRTLIATHFGAPLSSIIKKTNYRSINLFAEHMINLSGYDQTGDGSTQSGLDVLEKHWTGKINTSGLQLNDGSGLSRTNAIAAHHFTQLLSYMNKSTHAETFRESLPVAGESGTMLYICKGQTGHGRIAAKSGSMSRIRSYAGYVNTVSGKKLAFAIIVNNNTCTGSQLRSRMEVLMNQIAAY